MKTNKFKRILNTVAAVVLMSTISACGGGGGGGGGDSTKPNGNTGGGTTAATLKISSQPTLTQLIENETVTLSFSLTGIEGTLTPTVDYSALPDGSKATAAVNGSAVTVTVEVTDAEYHDKNIELNVSIEDVRTASNQTVEWSKSVKLVNTSGDALYDRYVAMNGAAQEYSNLAQERRLIERLAKLAHLVNAEGTISDQATLLGRINLAINNQAYEATLTSAIDAVNVYTDNYESGDYGETRLQDALGLLDEAVGNYSNAAYIVIQDAIDDTAGEVANYDYQKAYLSASGASYSSFVGNDSIGSFEGGVWTFNDAHTYLEAIAYPELETCNAE